MKYTNKTFSVAVAAHSMNDLLYDLRVGKITEAEYKRMLKKKDIKSDRNRESQSQ
jgi:hypothetical protein